MIQITGHTRFGGLLGSPVAHSLSPAMHNLSFAALNIDAVYLAFDVTGERLKEDKALFFALIFMFTYPSTCCHGGNADVAQ